MLQKKWALASYSFWIISCACFAQNLSAIQGKVVDSKTQAPLLGASVFLAHTTIGVYTESDGSFSLERVPPGKYDFTVSMVGYKTQSKPIAFTGDVIGNLIVTLEPSETQLDSVTISAKRLKQRNSDYQRFLRYFIGHTNNASQCKILNPEDVFVYEDHKKLIALASKTLRIENRALGYLIYYELKEFELDQVLNEISFAGIPRFEELIPTSGKQKARWTHERDRAYLGSAQHFLLSLKQGALESNNFEVTNGEGVALSPRDLMKDSLIYYPKKIYVNFKNEVPEIGYPMSYRAISQQSEVLFTGSPVKVYDNGYFENFHDIIFARYIAWSSRIAELMPLGYQPHKQNK